MAEIDDWVLVPRNPTPEMLDAWSFTWGDPNALNNWLAMIEAAPKPSHLVIVPATSELLRRGEETVKGGKVR